MPKVVDLEELLTAHRRGETAAEAACRLPADARPRTGHWRGQTGRSGTSFVS